jgi:hypothetical protein
MVWSAGQREFVPLLLGFYWLMPPAHVARREPVDWVVIEEPEMGLHPRAVSAVLALVLELLSRGYRVCLSTHSPHVLDVVWALRMIREHGANPDRVLDIFGARKTPPMRAMAREALKRTSKVYFFDRAGQVRDISGLDPGAADVAEAGWGGVSEFSGTVADIVSRVVAAAEGGQG